MTPKTVVFFLAGALAVGAAASQRNSEASFPFEEKEEISQTLSFPDPGHPGALVVDNVFGKIEVRAADRTDVAFVALKTIRAEGRDKMDLAKAEVKLDLKPRGADIEIYVDGPFRCQTRDCPGLRRRDWGYEVRYDFILQVPRRTNLTLKTIDDGAISIQGVEGAFDVSNVNGKIVLESVAGSGEVRTVNGEVRVSFVRNPSGACSFRTVNGDVVLMFRDNLAADFRLKTMNGKAFADFTSTALPPETILKEKRDDTTTFRRRGTTGIRIGSGGPEIQCETLNGDILIKKNH